MLWDPENSGSKLRNNVVLFRIPAGTKPREQQVQTRVGRWLQNKGTTGGLCRTIEALEKLWDMLKTIGDVSFLRINLNLTLGTFFFEWLCGQEVGLLVKKSESWYFTLFCCKQHSYNHNKMNIVYESLTSRLAP